MNPLPLWLKITLAGILLSGLWWRVEIYAHRDWGTDEINQYKAGLGELKPFWTLVYYCEAHSFPGDYVLTYPFIQIFHKDKWGVAIPHILSTLLGFYVLWLLCRRYFKNPAAWLITFSIFALHRELVFHALELRPYSLLISLGLCTFYILDSLISPSLSPSRLKCVLWWIVLILTIVYHPYGLYMIVCYGIFLLLRDGPKTGFIPLIQRRWIFWLSLMVVGLSLWIYYIRGNPLNSPQAMKAHHIEVFQFISNPMVNPLGFLRTVIGTLIGHKVSYFLSIGVLLRLLWPKQARLEAWGFLFIIIVLPIMLLLVSDSTFEYWFLQRQYIWVMAIFPFFAGKCWDEILNALPRKNERTSCP